MPRPTSSTTIQRPDLGAIAYEYMLEASQRGFIGLDILPIFPVSEQSADYPKIPIEAILRVPDTKRAPRGNYNRSDYEFETGTYACEEYGWEEPVDDTERKLYSRFFDASEVAVKRAVDILLRGQEKRISAAVFNTSNISNTSAVTTEWSAASSCTPRADVSGGKTAMRAATGLVPNVLAISLKVMENLLLAAEITDALKYTNPLEIGGLEAQKRILAQYFGVDKLLVGGAINDTGKKAKSFTITDIWDDEYCGLFKIASGKDLKDPALGRTFLWEADSPQNLVTESYREEQIRSDVYRVRHNVDEAFIFTGAGYLLSNITA
ncbi:hypothetical protein KAR91_05910 [Candidatus Pacearchaeota archaeon]|nr:hypothetical protein [Candidatus Pacearchaeota archaeon]